MPSDSVNDFISGLTSGIYLIFFFFIYYIYKYIIIIIFFFSICFYNYKFNIY